MTVSELMRALEDVPSNAVVVFGDGCCIMEVGNVKTNSGYVELQWDGLDEETK